MKNLSLKLEDNVFSETEGLLEKLNVSRNRYINRALEFYNKYQERKLLRGQLVRESEMVYGSSIESLEEFEAMEEDYEAI